MKEIGSYIQAFHMPLFFIVGGYFFKNQPLLVQIKRDSRRLIAPYLFVVISIALLESLKIFKSTKVFYFNFGTLYECGTPAWFLLALFGAKFLFNIIYNYSSGRPYLIYSFILSSIPCIVAYFREISPILSIGSSICGVFFYAIGYYINEKCLLFKFKKINIAFILISIIFWLNTSIIGAVDLHYCIFKLWFVDFIGALSGTYLCFILSETINNKTIRLRKYLIKVGYFSFVIYSFHAIEYVFPDWHQIVSFADNSACRAYIILFLRFSFAILFVHITIKSSLLRNLFFPRHN